ncbi:MAG TPA: YCF48-related protein [Usitatibacter sp.]|jgi:photosystem II stability/assembly factor-like uncharacterized protein|nr:YCF48-related protein [Usitatibacter sp.]
MRKIAGAAALCCGIVFSALADGPPAPGAPVGARTLQRLLLVDAKRAGSRIVAVGDRGYVVLSDDEGATWRRARAPDAPLLTAVAFADAKHGVAVGHDATILATDDGGESWAQVFTAPAEQRPLLCVRFVTPLKVIAAGAYGAYYESADGGRTWNARKIIPDDKHLNGIVDAGSGRLLIVGEAGTLLASSDQGATWKPLVSPYKGSFFGGLLAKDGAVVVFGLRGRIFRSTDGGATWSVVDNASDAAIMGGDSLPDGALVLAGAMGTALVSRDNGRSFQPIETHTSHLLSKPLVGAPNQLLLLGEAGVQAVALPLQRPGHTP